VVQVAVAKAAARVVVGTVEGPGEAAMEVVARVAAGMAQALPARAVAEERAPADPAVVVTVAVVMAREALGTAAAAATALAAMVAEGRVEDHWITVARPLGACAPPPDPRRPRPPCRPDVLFGSAL
jgi:hypothetical protein